MPTNETCFKPAETAWGDGAYDEVQNAFPGKLKSRELALCVWCCARQPDITELEIEAIAQRDAAIMEQRRQKGISPQGTRRAKSLLGLDAKSHDRVDPNLSDLEHKILSDLRATAALLDDYKKTGVRLRKAEATFEVARAKMLTITPESARLLAEFDPKTRPTLAAEGLLAPELDHVEPQATPNVESTTSLIDEEERHPIPDDDEEFVIDELHIETDDRDAKLVAVLREFRRSSP